MARSDVDVKAAIDVHEPQTVVASVIECDDVDGFIVEELASADLVVNGVGFERKTPSDFASSMLEGRLDEQVQKMHDAFDHSYILVDGDMADFEGLTHTRLNPQSMRGMAASLTARDGIPVIPCSETSTLVDFAVRLARKHTEDPVSDHLPTGDVGSSEPPAKQMWGCLPHVGPTMAERLFEEFGSPVALTEYNDPEAVLKDMDGIGDTTASDILDALGDSDV